ncbi:hypothetical protein JHK82_055514 [Glycine max]|nr:hypothetical protein JHK82_055514 [Glycine max]
MDYINTSHPNFIGGSKALEIAAQQTKSSRVAILVSRKKDMGFCINCMKLRAEVAPPLFA